MRKGISAVALALLVLISGCQEEIVPPVLMASGVTDITQTTATAIGNISWDGEGEIVTTGVVWDTNPSPDISLPTKTSSPGAGAQEFRSEITGLHANTKYYFRVYATNRAGIGYGGENTFVTEPEVAPTVSTSAATEITFYTALAGGNVVSAGTMNVTEKGIVYSQTEHPTMADTKVTKGEGIGAFTVALTGLTEKTKYFVRAYATSSVGTSYGNEINFSTASRVAPVVQTVDPTKITFNSAVIGGNVTLEGTMPVVERGIVYGLTAQPTITNTKIIAGKGKGTFTATLTGLTENTKYFVRAYATSDVGTSYGNEVIFTSRVESLPDTYFGRWYTMSGVRKYEFTWDRTIIFTETGVPYNYESDAISLLENGFYRIEAWRMGWPNTYIFNLKQGADTNAITIGSSLLTTQSLWKVNGRSVVEVHHGKGSAMLMDLDNGRWTEIDDAGNPLSWTLTETSRDDWSVYISRSDGARLKIDVKLNAMFFSPTPSGVMTEIYKFTDMFSR